MRFRLSKWNGNTAPKNQSIPYVLVGWILLVVLCAGCKQKDQKNAPSLFDSSGSPTRVVPPATGAAVGSYATPNTNTNAATQNRANNTAFYGMNGGSAPTNVPSAYPNVTPYNAAPTNAPAPTNTLPYTNTPAPASTSSGTSVPSGTTGGNLPAPPTGNSTGMVGSSAQPLVPQGSNAFTASNGVNPGAASQLAWRSPLNTNRTSNPTAGSATGTDNPTQLAMAQNPTATTTPLLTPVQMPPPPTSGVAAEHTAVAVAADTPLSRQQVLPVVYSTNPTSSGHAANDPLTASATGIPPTGSVQSTSNVQPVSAGMSQNAVRNMATQRTATNPEVPSSSVWNTVEDGTVPTPVRQNIRPRPIDAATVR